jgi:hypothetical protein
MKPFITSYVNLALLSLFVPLLLSSQTAQLSVAQGVIKNSATSKLPTNSTETYIDAPFGVAMQYPTTWSKAELYHNNSSILIVIFRTPSLLGSLNILGINHISTTNATLPSLVEAYITHLRQSGKLFQVISSTWSSLAGNAAVKLVYTSISPQGVKFEVMQEISLIGNKTFFITYGSPFLNYATYLPTAEQMISSMKIKQ